MTKLFKYIKKDIKTYWKNYLVFILIVPWFFIPFDCNIYSPGSLVDLTDRIEVNSNYESKGSFNLTYVTARKGTLPNIILSKFFKNWDIVGNSENRIEDESEKEIIERNKIYLKETSYDAIIAAFTEANIPYNIESIDVTVTHVYEYAKTNIKTGDIIKSIENTPIKDFNSLKEVIAKYKIGDTLKINVERNNKIIECTSKLVELESRVLIGVALSELKNIKTDPKVEYIFKENESGASRGLLCALDIYNKITEYDLTKGDIISGTGSINQNGIVGSIDGVKYKLAGAVKKHAKVFIVPTDNYKEALHEKEKNNYEIEIIEADTLHNVIEKLKAR